MSTDSDWVGSKSNCSTDSDWLKVSASASTRFSLPVAVDWFEGTADGENYTDGDCDLLSVELVACFCPCVSDD